MVNAFNDQTVELATTDGVTSYAFNLARDGQGNRVYHQEQRPSKEGDPDRPFVMRFPFGYLGMGSSKSNRIPDTYDYGQGDARFLDRLYPPPKANAITWSAQPTDTVRAIWTGRSSSGAEYVYAAGGTRIRKIGIVSAGPVTADQDFEGLVVAGATYGQPTPYGGAWYVPQSAGNIFVRLTTVATAPTADTWETASGGSGVQALAFARGVLAGSTTPLLIRGTADGAIATASTGLLDSANWSALYQVAPQGELVNGLVVLDDNLFVSSSAGLYSVDKNVNGQPLTPELQSGSNAQAGRPCLAWHGKVYYPHHTGLYRTVNGLTRTVGTEVLPAYVRGAGGPSGRVTAMAGTAHWLYVAYYNGSGSWVLAGREREAGEPGPGEMVWHSIASVAGECGAMCVYQGNDSLNPRLYVGAGAGLVYFVLGRNGGLDRDDSAYRWTTDTVNFRLAPNDLGHPGTTKVAETAELFATVSASSTVVLNNGWDLGTDNNQVGTNVTSSGFQTLPFTKGSNDSGRKLSLNVSFQLSAANAPSYLENGEILVRGRERPDQVREITLLLDIHEGTPAIAQGQTALELEAQLRAWKETGAALSFSDHFGGESFTCRIQEVVRDEASSDAGGPPGYRVRLRIVEALN